MKTWDSAAMHRTFQIQAQRADDYAKKCKKESGDSSFRKILHDEALAEFDVYDAFYGKTVLDTRESYLARLRKMLSETPKYLDEAFDRKRFLDCQQALIRRLVAQEEKNSSS